MTVRTALSEWVKARMAENQMTADAFAKALEVSRPTAYAIIAGRNKITFERAIQVAEVFHVAPENLVTNILERVKKGS